MKVYFPILFSAVLLALVSALEIFLLKKLHRDWWRFTFVRRLSYGLPLVGIAGLLLWAGGVALERDFLVNLGGTLTTVVIVMGIALMISLPLSGLVHGIDRLLVWLARRRRDPGTDTATAEDVPVESVPGIATTVPASNASDGIPDPRRRKFLTTSAAVFPLIAITAGGSGLATAYAEPRIPRIPLRFPGLPAALEGLRILHITDVHIGLIIGMQDLARMVERCAAENPDIVMITGDFSDDADSYLDALRLVGTIPHRYGAFACIGNHEYFRGIAAIRRAYDKGPIPLLLNSGTTIDVGGASLYVAGADDPRSNFGLPEGFFSAAIGTAMQDAPVDAFSILLCHRPNGFEAAARAGVDLTLSGHTHGGQIGFNGRSLLYATNPERYMWGRYTRGDSVLSVSAGAGHWFPYRLGCPTEIPLYVLTADGNSAQE